MLDIPQIAYVSKVEEVNLQEKRIKVQRMNEEGYEVIQTKLPCLLTVVKEINEPRLPSLKGKMRAKKTEIKIWSAKDINTDEDKIGLKGSATQVIKIFSPPHRKGGQILQGDTKEIAEKLAGILREI